MLSRVRLFATPRPAARQAPLSTAFPRNEYRGGLPFPSPGHLPNPAIEPVSPALQADSVPLSHPGSPLNPQRDLKRRFLLCPSYK